MNRAYRLIWNELTRTWVAVSELTRSHGKRKSVVAATAASLALATTAHALGPNTLPTSGQVVAGNATISQTANTLNINQTTQRTAINWQSFNIGSAATVKFQQPNSSAVALNRILGNEASQIYGKLNANGQVFFSNPNGILFAKGAEVNVGGILTTTMSIGNDDFMAGNYQFSTPGTGTIRNEGILKAQHSVALIGDTVQNTGQIIGTTVTLAAGNKVAIDLTGDNLIRARIDEPSLKAAIENSGNIEAQTAITMTAGQARNAISSVVNNSGVVKATGLIERGGEIILEAATVENSGTIDASSTTGTGGNVQIKATQAINLTETSKVGADGTAGGTVLAITREDGKVTGTLTARGSISAQGGKGFIETSAGIADIGGLSVKASSGLWLIDPYNYTIDATAASSINSTLNGGTSVSIDTTNNTGPGAGASGNGDITVSSAISKTVGNDATLTLNAHNNININAGVSSTSNKLNLALNANSDATGGGASYTSQSLSLNGGTLTISGGNLTLNNGATIANATVTSSGAASLSVPYSNNYVTLDGVTLGANLTVDTGHLTLKNGLTLTNGATVSLLDNHGWDVNYAGYSVDPHLRVDGTQTIGVVSGQTGFITFGGNSAPAGSDSIEMLNGASLTIGAGVTVKTAGQGGSINLGPNGINRGTISAETAGKTINIKGTSWTNEGTLVASAGTLSLGGTMGANAGTIQAGAGMITTNNASLTNAATGKITGTGILNLGTGTLTNNGTISPGVGAGGTGTLSITAGSVVLGSTGKLEIDIAGTGVGQYDKLAVTGPLTVGGNLTINQAGSYAPATGDAVSFLTRTVSAGSSGTFASQTAPANFNTGYYLATGEAARTIYASANTNIFLNGTGDLKWDTVANWSANALPNSGTEALISSGYTVSHSIGNDTIGALTITSGNALNLTGGSIAVLGSTIVGGTLTLGGGTLTQNGNASIANLAINSGSLAGVGSVTVTNSFSKAGGSIASTLTGLNITQASGNLTPGALNIDGAITLTATNGSLNLTGALTSNGRNITLTADQMSIGASVNAGAGLISLQRSTNSTSKSIQIGTGVTDSTAVLAFDPTELGYLTGTGGLTIGNNLVNGGLRVLGASPSGITGGNLSLVANSPIVFDGKLTSSADEVRVTSTNNGPTNPNSIDGILFRGTGAIEAVGKTVRLTDVYTSVINAVANVTRIKADTLVTDTKYSLSGSGVTPAYTLFGSTTSTVVPLETEVNNLQFVAGNGVNVLNTAPGGTLTVNGSATSNPASVFFDVVIAEKTGHLNVAGLTSTGGGRNISLTTQGTGKNLALNGAINTYVGGTGGSLTLNSAGTITGTTPATAGSISLTSAGNIGTSSSAPLYVVTPTLDAVSSNGSLWIQDHASGQSGAASFTAEASSGSIWFTNYGATTIPTPPSGRTYSVRGGSAGGVTLTANSPLTVNGSITSGGGINLTAGGTGSTDTLTLNGVTLTVATGSSVSLTGGTVSQTGTNTIQTVTGAPVTPTATQNYVPPASGGGGGTAVTPTPTPTPAPTPEPTPTPTPTPEPTPTPTPEPTPTPTPTPPPTTITDPTVTAAIQQVIQSVLPTTTIITTAVYTPPPVIVPTTVTPEVVAPVTGTTTGEGETPPITPASIPVATTATSTDKPKEEPAAAPAPTVSIVVANTAIVKPVEQIVMVDVPKTQRLVCR
jgi:filamentous hemagglutinin family protein